MLGYLGVREETIVILLQTSKEAAGYGNRYATALYLGRGGYPLRKGLVQRQYYVGRILDGGRFHVLKPDRLCEIADFASFQLVSRRWHELTELERSLLLAVFNQNKLALDTLPAGAWDEVATCLMRDGYLRWADEPQSVELTATGEAEVQHRIGNLSAGETLTGADKGIRVTHNSVNEHEIELGCGSTLLVNVDGMLIRIFTLKDSGAVIRVDHDPSHRVYMQHTDKDEHFAQAYVDRITP